MQQSFKTFNAEMEVYDVDLDLLKAVEDNDMAKVNDALTLGADPACVDRNGRFPLGAAVFRGHDEIALALINAGAPLTAHNPQSLTPLRSAMKGGHLSSVELLFKEGANPRGSCPDPDIGSHIPDYMYAETNCTPEITAIVEKISDRKWLIDSVIKGFDFDVKEFLEKGVPADTEIEPGVTCLLYAAAQGNAAIAKILLEHGADARKTDNDGRTSMHRAAAANSCEIIELFIGKGASVFVTDAHGKTPMAYAAGGAAIKMLEKCAEIEAQRMIRVAQVKPMATLRLRPKL